MNRRPASTYRVQVSADFPLADAAELADYLRTLGADWFYLSPLLAATPGSTHGYDVVDHSRVDPERGGSEGLERLSRAAGSRGLGVLVDIVPNHMGVGVPHENAWWWDVLTHGQHSAHAHAFDIDWAAGGGRVRIPVLGESIADAAASGALRIEEGELRYYDHRYPLAPGTADDGAPVEAVHDRQHYELMHWTRADAELNYRRFFGVNELAAVRVELPDVFADTHREIARWVSAGLVHGIRVDHPDGLLDPGRYLDDLAEATGGCYVLVEKILEPGEQLPPFWATAGTTGYDALGDIDRVLVDPAGRAELGALDSRLRGGSVAWADVIHGTKRAIADGLLRSEVNRLVREVRGAGDAGQHGDDELADAIAELLACFPVYRSYLPFGIEHLEHALTDAEGRRPDLAPVLRTLSHVIGDPEHPAARRFQQTSGMVMAKGVEDTAFYRTSRLASLTEVGGDPSEFAVDVAEYHRRQQARLATHPESMTTLSTHDTKRGEDTRARIDAIAEVPEVWVDFLERRRDAFDLGDGPLENLLWESVVGAWPREREALHGYAEKAAREAGTSTRWTAPDEAFEQRLHAFIDRLFDDADTRDDLERMVSFLRPAGWSNGLAAKLLQLASPGVPDVYQGSELWERSLVDPDNRRPVDFALRRKLLARIDGGELPPIDETGAAKLLVTSRVLRLRRDRPDLFTRYTPLPTAGHASDHVVAFDRGGAIAVATRLPLGLEAVGGWDSTELLTPAGAYVDVLTGATVEGGRVPLAGLLERYPVALLVKEEAP
ncbi:malto-oligosyltrehalose synthase [Protaetiibacter sp. SSC-01]|uniref:malto-oligosyltrehalose synthase n=1 Tax=Protaetiibacter sp. SSC-01 TaxID=2759943 RepID=UPI001656D65D|nr:malto-oligosyltrehalose synthase [Protaetiibacter sp. SSC-01]QNO37221.1 malto-oligosyltrehalose synthase [Protaetiibacter sp. SSC-01]